MNHFKLPPIVKFGKLEIDVEKFHILKMLDATVTKSQDDCIFIGDAKFVADLLKEGLCSAHPNNDNSVVGTQKLANMMPAVEILFYGDNND